MIWGQGPLWSRGSSSERGALERSQGRWAGGRAEGSWSGTQAGALDLWELWGSCPRVSPGEDLSGVGSSVKAGRLGLFHGPRAGLAVWSGAGQRRWRETWGSFGVVFRAAEMGLLIVWR